MLSTDGCLSQVLAVFESFELYLNTCRQRDRCEAVATLKCVRVDKFQVRRHRHLCQGCVLEGVLPDSRYRLREVDVSKRLAVFKGSGVYLVDVLWQRNLCQRPAAPEHAVLQLLKTCRQLDFCQPCTRDKAAVSDGFHAVGHADGFECRNVAEGSLANIRHRSRNIHL